MNVTVAEPAEIVLRNLGDDDRKWVCAWIDSLKRWETDAVVRQHAKKLDTGDNVYMLFPRGEFRIFFALGEGTITVLDVATRATILSSRQTSGAG